MPTTRLTPSEPIERKTAIVAVDALASLVRMDARRPGLLPRLVESFRESAGDCVDRLWEALARGETERLRELTHRLAGTSSQMGAAALADACAVLSKSANAPEAVQRMCELEALAERTLAELDRAVVRKPRS